MHVKVVFSKNEGESPAPDDLRSPGSSQSDMETDHPPDGPAHSPNRMEVDPECPLISTEGDTDTGLSGTEESRARGRSSSGRGRGRGRARGRGRGRGGESDTNARHPGTQSSTERGSRRGRVVGGRDLQDEGEPEQGGEEDTHIQGKAHLIIRVSSVYVCVPTVQFYINNK